MRRTLSALLLAACSGGETPPPVPPPVAPPVDAPPVTITVVGTNDLHGHVERLPLLAGYVSALRALRAADGGAVVLLDGGDMFQGTLESNLAEGAPVVLAYEALGYDAVTIGNHEFDYGPVGDATIPASPSDDPRGALRARIAEADFPVLSANTVRTDGSPMGIGEEASITIERAGVRIGLVGVTTESTLHTTMSGNVSDLRIDPLVATITREATRLRAAGAHVVVVLAHAGGRCEHLEDPSDLSSCDAHEEIFEVATALPVGMVDVIVAGHTHQAVAHVVNGVAIVESWAYGRAFGRVDLVVQGGHVTGVHVSPPQDLCAERIPDDADPAGCRRSPYEGHTIAADASVASLIAPAMEAARVRREERLGPELTTTVTYDRGSECALGNLFTDLMLAARPTADVALINGGGLRAELPEGALTYGRLFTAFPFDNRFAIVRMSGAELADMLADDAGHGGSVLSVSGVRVEVRCTVGHRVATLRRADGSTVAPDTMLSVLASDFMATGGDGFFRALLERDPSRATIEESETIRDAMASVLRTRGGRIVSSELFDADRPRVAIRGGRPLRCD